MLHIVTLCSIEDGLHKIPLCITISKPSLCLTTLSDIFCFMNVMREAWSSLSMGKGACLCESGRQKPTTQANSGPLHHNLPLHDHDATLTWADCVIMHQLMNSKLNWYKSRHGLDLCYNMDKPLPKDGLNSALTLPTNKEYSLRWLYWTKHRLCQTRTTNMAYIIFENRVYIVCSYVHIVIIYYCIWFCEPSSFSNWDNVMGVIVSLFLKNSCPALTSWTH